MIYGWTTTQITERINTFLKSHLVDTRRRAIGIDTDTEEALLRTSHLFQVARTTRILTHMGACPAPPRPAPPRPAPPWAKCDRHFVQASSNGIQTSRRFLFGSPTRRRPLRAPPQTAPNDWGRRWRLATRCHS
jgi:hypothetical protein